jgi:hypothetical protein
MSSYDVPLERGRFGQTSRPDAWWLYPLLTFLGLGSFIVYSTWAAFQGKDYISGPYLSPMYAPLLFGQPGEDAWFGAMPEFLPSFVTAAMLILWAPGGFRLTCYYYRGAYYKAFWADPPNCTVGEPRKKYLGERYFPLIVQNVHRYFMYLALIFLLLLAYDVYKATQFPDGFGIGIGTLVLLINVILLGSYTLGCHSLRHLVGGLFDRLSRHPARKKAYDCVSCLNRRHMLFAWLSLFWVGFSDLYIRLCAMHIWTDLRFF